MSMAQRNRMHQALATQTKLANMINTCLFWSLICLQQEKYKTSPHLSLSDSGGQSIEGFMCYTDCENLCNKFVILGE